jgi:dGTPase
MLLMPGLNTRGRLEEREEFILAPWACLSRESRGRRHAEAEAAHRSAFQRDRDRIIHATSFRRLEYKTQVFIYHEGDHYRNRLTHSLETAQIGRSIARMLNLNEDLVEAMALAHDLGHPPFGHAGERVLDGMMRAWGGFEHNRQSLRVVEVIEHRYPGFRGLNLSWETREGLAKHHTDFDVSEPGPYAPGILASLEAQVVNLADEIAYTAHDLDDGITSELISFRSLHEAPLWEECYREAEAAAPGEPARLVCAGAIRALIGLLVSDCAEATLAAVESLGIRSPDDARTAARTAACFSPALAEQFQALKGFLNRNLYHHYRVRRMEVKAEKVLSELFTAYVDDPELLPPGLRAHFNDAAPERIICDYLAGMTDRYSIRQYQKLFDLTERF